MTRSPPSTGKRSYTSSLAARQSKQRYLARQRGEIPAVPLMNVDDAVKVLQ